MDCIGLDCIGLDDCNIRKQQGVGKVISIFDALELSLMAME
jgi:hypothetical protein